MYARNKMNYLKNQGYNVNIFHCETGRRKIIIRDLLEYEKNSYLILNHPAYLFSIPKQEEVISSIYQQVPKQCDELIIESLSIATATWGELIAEKLNAKNIVFLLSEYNSLRNDTIYEFFKFKLKRRELAGIQNKSISQLFCNREKIDEKFSYQLDASCTNVVEDIPYPMMLQIPHSDFKIASIGRLNKLFLINILDDVISFIKEHDDKSFTIILIGGELHNSGAKKKIVQKFEKIKNVRLFFTGYIYPIPRELVLLPDIFISSAGSCTVSSSLGKLTISIDSNDHKPIGIMGKTTNNTLFRDNEPIVSIKELLDDILIKKIYKSDIINLPDNPQVDFSEHLKFILNSDNSIAYFNINAVRLSLKDWIEKIALFLLGNDLLNRLEIQLLPLWNKLR